MAPPQLTAPIRIMATKVARMMGAPGDLDPDAPIVGMTAAQFSAAFGVRCVVCVDADSVTVAEVRAELDPVLEERGLRECDTSLATAAQ
jgi:hypothetical protein